MQGRCRGPADWLNENSHAMQRADVPFLLARVEPLARQMNKAQLALDWFFALMPSALNTA